MKHTLIILFAIFCLCNNARAQSAVAAIDSIIKYKVITAKDRPTMDWALRERGGASWRARVLSGLNAVLFKKEYHIDLQKTYAFTSVNYEKAGKKRQDSINVTLRPLLEKIKKSGLLTYRVYMHTLAGIDSGRYRADVEMISYLSELSFRLEWLAPANLLPVAKQLHESGVVSDSSFIRFESDIKANKIESVIELNNYCRLDRIFDLAKYPDDPDIWLEQFHRDIASILPGLNFTGFSYTAIPDTSFSLPGVRFTISLDCDGRTYKHTSPPFLTKNGKIIPGDMFIEDFYRIFNKILTDRQSPLRLHSINYTFGNDGDNFRRFALIALNKEQAEALMTRPCLSYMFATMEDYDNTLTSAKIDSLVRGWKKLGLFTHLSDAEVTKSIDKTIADERYSIDGLLSNFPGVVYPLDSAFSNQDYSYTKLLLHLAQITHGVFRPIKITQRKEKNGVILRYFFNGKIHSYRFRSGFWMTDATFPAFISSLGTENNLPGDFYPLPDTRQVIYLSKQQHDDALQHRLLEFEQEDKGKRRPH